MLIKKKNQPLKVGVLLPRSDQYPTISSNFLNGIKLYFTVNENNFERGRVELIIEDIGFGTEQLSIEKAHKLIAQEQVILIVSLLQPVVALQLAHICDAAGVPLINSSLGEALVSTVSLTESIFFNSLLYWQSYYLLGKWAASKWNRPLVIYSSFYDSGYDPLRSFRLGVLNNGGNIEAEYITHFIDDHNPLKKIEDSLFHHQDVTLLALYHPKLLPEVLSVLSDKYEDILTSPFSASMPKANRHWAIPNWFDSGEKKMEELNNGTLDYFDTDPDTFHLLGFEAGQLIYDSFQSLDDPQKDGDNLINSLRTYKSKTPRGDVSMCPVSQSIFSSTSIFSQISSDGSCVREDFERVIDSADESLGDLQTDMKSNFLNPYLFF